MSAQWDFGVMYHMGWDHQVINEIFNPDLAKQMCGSGKSAKQLLELLEHALECGHDASQMFTSKCFIPKGLQYYEARDDMKRTFGYLSRETYDDGFYMRREGLIHNAARQGRLGLVKCLLKHGVPVDSLDGQNKTALFIASVQRHHSVVKYLIEKGADVNRSYDRISDCHCFKCTEMSDYLLHLVCQGGTITRLSQGVSIPIVKILLDAGADAFAITDGCTAKRRAINGRTRALAKDKPAFDLVIAMLEKAMTFQVTEDAIEIPAAELQCSICHDVSEKKDWCHVACCNSQFHVGCMTHWLDCSKNNDCPLCRGQTRTGRKVVSI
jgi:hypothetical protein